jgi:hypothetical protein
MMRVHARKWDERQASSRRGNLNDTGPRLVMGRTASLEPQGQFERRGFTPRNGKYSNPEPQGQFERYGLTPDMRNIASQALSRRGKLNNMIHARNGKYIKPRAAGAI